MKPKFFIPIGFFFLLAVLLYKGLSLDPKKVPSPFIGKPAPNFVAPTLYDVAKTVSPENFLGEVWVLNIFASWCVSCRAEHKIITKFAKQSGIRVVGLNYKDTTEDAKQWLSNFGNPYSFIAVDMDGQIGIDWGVYGVPESFVVDKKGIIRYKQIGPLTDVVLLETINPLIEKLKKEKR